MSNMNVSSEFDSEPMSQHPMNNKKVNDVFGSGPDSINMPTQDSYGEID